MFYFEFYISMKRLLVVVFVVLIVGGLIGAWFILGSATNFAESKKFLYVHTGQTSEAAVLQEVEDKELIKYPIVFKMLANEMDVWSRIKPGRYKIEKGDNLITIIRMLRNHQQEPVDLVINKLRTGKDLARLLGKNFEVDSADVYAYITHSDSLTKIGITSDNILTVIIPNTYTLYWNTSTGKILSRLKSEQEKFWKSNNRLEKAAQAGLTPKQVYIIASIVEEETNKNDEKGKVASVYINRYRSGMPLGADPTIKYALQDFGLKRIYHKHLLVQSPYNTYRNVGLPPGPICTPSPKTIDAVLQAPNTDYLYFVARKDFSGYHTFSTTYTEHLQNAREYQKALDELILKKQKAAISNSEKN